MNQAFRVQICNLFDVTFFFSFPIQEVREESNGLVQHPVQCCMLPPWRIPDHHQWHWQKGTRLDWSRLMYCTGMCLRERKEGVTDRQESREIDTVCTTTSWQKALPVSCGCSRIRSFYSVPNNPSASLRTQHQCPFKDHSLLAYVCGCVLNVQYVHHTEI